MNKRPEEIKKGLEMCSVDGECKECPYQNEIEDCIYNKLQADALAYIQQLEQENANLKEMLRNADRHIKGLEAERDAAVADLKEMCASCSDDTLCCNYCKYQEDDLQCHHDCKMYTKEWDWQWRGVCESNGGKDGKETKSDR